MKKNDYKLFGVRLKTENWYVLDTLAKNLNVKRNTMLNIILNLLKQKDLKKLEKILEI